ncbi:hypothetical protein [Nonomuraea sp. NPDC048916]|uniref:hypothetical protein n=1 Tax=Nonomuraea sp. NPDC048916 TaxID=3154232 RepID=UPI0033DCC6F8
MAVLPRLLLLLLLTLGVVAMHTLGHLDGHDAPPSAATGALHVEGGHLAVPDSDSGTVPSGTPDTASICLTILVTLVTLALLRVRRAGPLDAWSRDGSRLAQHVTGLLRGPPPLSLTPKHTVVLRI